MHDRKTTIFSSLKELEGGGTVVNLTCTCFKLRVTLEIDHQFLSILNDVTWVNLEVRAENFRMVNIKINA